MKITSVVAILIVFLITFSSVSAEVISKTNYYDDPETDIVYTIKVTQYTGIDKFFKFLSNMFSPLSIIFEKNTYEVGEMVAITINPEFSSECSSSSIWPGYIGKEVILVYDNTGYTEPDKWTIGTFCTSTQTSCDNMMCSYDPSWIELNIQWKATYAGTFNVQYFAWNNEGIVIANEQPKSFVVTEPYEPECTSDLTSYCPSSGSSIVVKQCINGEYKATGFSCPEPPPEQITCYACNFNGDIISEKFDQCPLTYKIDRSLLDCNPGGIDCTAPKNQIEICECNPTDASCIVEPPKEITLEQAAPYIIGGIVLIILAFIIIQKPSRRRR